MMLHLSKRIFAVVAACALTCSIAPAVDASLGANAAVSRDITATLTAKHGTVFKRDFRDWNRDEWGEPAPAEISDQLREGMQIGTGNDSWAEVQWPNVKTRAWANTVFSVAPNKRLVYLTGGEMLFRLDKHRKDKDEYYIWTKVLQARIRGTTVLVQAKGPVTRFTVMEGVVEITNRLDKSRAVLKPGAIWEIRGFNIPKRGSVPGMSATGTDANLGGAAGSLPPNVVPGNVPELSSPNVVPKNFDDKITDITYDAKNYLPIFQDKYASSNLFASNKDALLNHPLINAGGAIDSLPLILDAQRDLPGYSKFLPFKLTDATRLNRMLAGAVELVGVPTKANYYIGQSVGREIKLPPVAVGDTQWEGMLMNPATVTAARPSFSPPLSAPRVAPVPIIAPVLTAPVDDAASIFQDDSEPLPAVPPSAPQQVSRKETLQRQF